MSVSDILSSLVSHADTDQREKFGQWRYGDECQ